MECISSNWTAPLINGRPCSGFKSSRGLRQGCPLSPFLYIIMAETLSLLLENKRRLKEITRIDIVRGAKGINHSLFADDTLLIGGASILMARRFKETLDLLLQASGGKLSNNKCMIYTWNFPRHITQRISIIMEIPAQGNWSYFKYLGLPPAKDTIKSEIWVKLIEKLRGKLQSWGMYWLNLAGRTTLIKAILSALPIYQFAITLVPASIHKHMELIICSFLWQGGKQDTKKFSVVKWSKVILSIEKGGLGIRVPRLANIAMGFKLIWRILIEKGSWWTDIIKKKYLNGPNSNILLETIIDRHCTPVWKLIKKSLPQFKPHISKALGNGSGNSVWDDRIMGMQARGDLPKYRPLQQWMNQANLKTLYDISQWDQNVWKGWKSLALPNDLTNIWVDFKASLFGSAPTNRTSEDKFIWDPSGGCYTVKEGYKTLQNTAPINNWSLHKVAWKIESLPKITTLQKSWGKCFPQTNKRKNQVSRIWNSIPSNLCWQIWIARNKCIFNNKKPCIARTIAKTVALISKTIETNGFSQIDPEQTEAKVQEWVNKFNIEARIKKKSNIDQGNQEWKLRGTKKEVENWIQKQRRPTLHFDGASKNNPGQAGAGGIIKDPQGKTIVKYEWGLGTMSNNKAEAYSLLLGTSIAQKLGLQNLLILGDSAIIIASMSSGKEFRQTALNRIRGKIIENTRNLREVSFKHILRGNNSEADQQANNATGRKIGQVKENDQVYEEAIP
eukprot:PITA_02659